MRLPIVLYLPSPWDDDLILATYEYQHLIIRPSRRFAEDVIPYLADYAVSGARMTQRAFCEWLRAGDGS